MSRKFGAFDPASTATTTIITVAEGSRGIVEAVAQNFFPFESTAANLASGDGVFTSVGAFSYSSAVGTPYGAGTALRVEGGAHMEITSAGAVQMMEFSSAFTFEFWAYRSSGANDAVAAQIIDSRSNGNNPNNCFLVGFNSGKLTVSPGASGGANQQIASTVASLNVWQHYAIARDSSMQFRMFYDGVKKYDASYTIVSDNKATGGRPHFFETVNNSYGFTGWFRDLRIFKDVCIYTTAFPVTTQPLQATSNNIGISTTTTIDTRSHSHVWNYSDIYKARRADTWPTIDTGPTPLSHIVRFDASMSGAVDTAAGTWTSVTGSRHPTTLINGTTATLLIGDQNGLNVVRTNSAFTIASADQVSTITSAYAFVCVYSRNSDTSNNDIYPVRTGVGNDNNSIGIEIRPSAISGSHDFDIYGGNSRDREVAVAGVDFQSADYTRYLIMASGNSSDGIHNVKVVVRGGTSSAVTLGTNGSNRATAPKFSDSNVQLPHAGYNNNIDYCEIIFYDVELSSADMITEADRLATKWGL